MLLEALLYLVICLVVVLAVFGICVAIHYAVSTAFNTVVVEDETKDPLIQ